LPGDLERQLIGDLVPQAMAIRRQTAGICSSRVREGRRMSRQ
jgi:hypothetical protein